jgi:two-component system chemotaxis response regulator CheV
LGKSVGVDEYVSKFEAQRLAETLSRFIKSRQPDAAAVDA